MKKFFLTIVVVSALFLSTTLMSMAAPRDIPGDFAPSTSMENPVENSKNNNDLEWLELC